MRVSTTALIDQSTFHYLSLWETLLYKQPAVIWFLTSRTKINHIFLFSSESWAPCLLCVSQASAELLRDELTARTKPESKPDSTGFSQQRARWLTWSRWRLWTDLKAFYLHETYFSLAECRSKPMSPAVDIIDSNSSPVAAWDASPMAALLGKLICLSQLSKWDYLTNQPTVLDDVDVVLSVWQTSLPSS